MLLLNGLSPRPVTQVAILAGDFLLARASVSLAALRDTEVIELLSQVIEHLVSGEILQACCAVTSPACIVNRGVIWPALLCTYDGGGSYHIAPSLIADSSCALPPMR